MIHRYKISIPVFILLFFSAFNLLAQIPAGMAKPQPAKSGQPAYIANPSAWINESYTQLNDLYLYRDDINLDSIALFDQFAEHQVIIDMLKSTFYSTPALLDIRSVYNMKMRVSTILDDISKWQRQIHKVNELLVKRPLRSNG